MIQVTRQITLRLSEVKFSFIASPGPGGQNVNKVATGVLLRFNVRQATGMSEAVRARLMALCASQLTGQGELIIKATRHRTQERNKQDALDRLCYWLKRAAVVPKTRKKTKPTRASKERRLTAKRKLGEKKLGRKKEVY